MRKFSNSYTFNRYIKCIDSKHPEHDSRIIIANLYSFLEDYLNTINIQFKRLEDDNTELEKAMDLPIGSFEKHIPFLKFSSDVHFLLVAIDKSYKLIITLYKKLNLNDTANSIYNNPNRQNISKLRNNLEHIDEKLIQGWDKSKDKEPGIFKHLVNWFAIDFRTFSDDTLNLGKNSFKISPKSLEHLYNCYDNITNILLKKYIEPNKKDIDNFWKSFEEWRNNNQTQN